LHEYHYLVDNDIVMLEH